MKIIYLEELFLSVKWKVNIVPHCMNIIEWIVGKFNKIQQKLNICFIISVTFRQARSNVELTVPKQIAFRAQTWFKNTDQLWFHIGLWPLDCTSDVLVERILTNSSGLLLWWDRDLPLSILKSTSIDFLSLCVCKNIWPIKAWDSAAGRHCLDRLLMVSTLICKHTPCLRGILSDWTPGSDRVTQLPALRLWQHNTKIPTLTWSHCCESVCCSVCMYICIFYNFLFFNFQKAKFHFLYLFKKIIFHTLF